MRQFSASRLVTSCVCVCFSAALSAITPTSFADELADANKLLQAGKTVDALQKVDAGLAQKPKDRDLRFLKGLILAEQKKSADAIIVFTKLTDDYPSLPEPYNNLAVLYAESGQYDKARAALEMAIRTNPTYGTAHENLGDVYAKLASQAYDKAFQLDGNNSGAKLKLTLVRNLIGNTTGGVNPKAITPATPPTPNAITPVTPSVTSAAPSTTNKPVTAPVVAEVKEKPAKAEAKPAVKEPAEVIKTVEAWAKAWSNKDTSAYLGYYAQDFRTPNGESRKAWAEERRARIEGKGRISVKLESMNASVDGNTATVKFRQIYNSDRLTANSKKILELTKQGGKWLIKQERAGS
jgi:tetratricopeptide (TPR) repeat protein